MATHCAPQAQVLLSVLRSAIVKVPPGEKTCSETVPLFTLPSIRANSLRSGPFCSKVMMFPLLVMRPVPLNVKPLQFVNR